VSNPLLFKNEKYKIDMIDSGKLNHVFINGIASAPQEVTNRTSFVSLTKVYTVRLENNIPANVKFFVFSFLGGGRLSCCD
jgi:hypothetical protein